MESVSAGCAQVEAILDEMSHRCQAYISRLDIFDMWVTQCMWRTLMAKLGFLAMNIGAWKQVLEEQHSGKGEIVVFMSNQKGITLWWVEDPRLVADRDWYKQCGYTVMSFDEVLRLITQKISDALSGHWLPVLEWLQTYGNISGLDIREQMRKAGWPW